MTAGRAEEGVKDGDGGHRAAGHRRHGGPPAGQAPHGQALPRRGARARRRGLQLPARGRRGHGHRGRLRDVLLGARLRRLRDEARSGHAAADPLARRHRDGHGRPRSGRTAARWWPRHGRSCAASWPGWPSAGYRVWRARSSSSSSSATPTRTHGTGATATSTPANLYNLDYSLLGTARVEPLIRRIRNEMLGAGMAVENSKGECNFGQHEINFHYGEALQLADDHAIYKNGVKEIAAQEEHVDHVHRQVNEEEGNSCHVHCSWPVRGRRRTPSARTDAVRALRGRPLACMRELTLFFAPHVNSYKRFAEGSFAPTAIAWGKDNRTCALRVVGHGQSLRIENRMPGRRRQPLPRAERHDRRRACTGSRTSWSSSRRWRATPTRRVGEHVPRRSARRATCSPAARWRARPSGRRWWTTTSTTPGSS